MVHKWYIAGPMSGYPELNFPAFYSLEDALMRAGIGTVNPAALDEAGLPEGVPDDEFGMGLPLNKQKFLLRDFRELVFCTGIIMLPDWHVSVGANCELAVAKMTGIKTYRAQVSSFRVEAGGDVEATWDWEEDDLLTPSMKKVSDYIIQGTLANMAREQMEV